MLVPGNRSAMLRVLSAAITFVVLTSLTACGGDAVPGPTATSAAGSPAASAAGDETPSTSAENALYFYPPVNGATIKLTNTGAVGGTTDVTVRTVVSGADQQTVTVKEVNSGSGTPVTVERTFRTGPDGSLSIDASAFGASAPGFRVTATGDDVLIPPITDLETGRSSTGKTFVEFTGSGVTGRNDVTYVVTGAGFKPVTVKAGSVEAYVVKLELNIKSSFAGVANGTATYWFRPGFGLVRQETTVAGSTIVTELTSTSVPFA